jgi:dTDP-4-dehydrorhamnose 3,5-epimerase
MNNLKKILLIKSKIINNELGDILCVLKKNQLPKYWNFKEVYFSKIKFNNIKAWKMHKKMYLNLFVPFGSVKFVFYSEDKKKNKEIILSDNKYFRLSVPPKIWFGFKGLNKPYSLILNVANFYSRESEVARISLNRLDHDWNKLCK